MCRISICGGQLEEEFLDALTERLQARLPQTRLQNVPWELEQTPQYQFVLSLSRFDGAPNGLAVMKGSWVLQRPESGKLVKSGRIDLQGKVNGDSVDAVVRAQSSLVGDLAGQLVAALP
ncbi:MAG: PqiC family protein [Thiolinea sp.]